MSEISFIEHLPVTVLDTDQINYLQENVLMWVDIMIMFALICLFVDIYISMFAWVLFNGFYFCEELLELISAELEEILVLFSLYFYFFTK